MSSPLGNILQDIADSADSPQLPTPEAVRVSGDLRRRRLTLGLAAVAVVVCSMVLVGLAALRPSDRSTGPVNPVPSPSPSSPRPSAKPPATDARPGSSSHPIETGPHRFSAHAVAAIGGRFVVVGDSSDLENPGPPVYWSDNGIDWQAPTAGNGPTSVNVTDVIATPEGLLAVGVGPDRRAAAWRSVDGRTWTESSITPPTGGASSVWGLTDTRLGYYAWGFDQGKAGLWHSTDGATWRPVADQSVFDLPLTEAICAVRDTPGGLQATGVEAPPGTREGHSVGWTSTDGQTWVLAQAAGEPTIWCDPTLELGHWEARGEAGVVRVYPYGSGNTAQFNPTTP